MTQRFVNFVDTYIEIVSQAYRGNMVLISTLHIFLL